ncbi:MAG: T9SS type A sorting domain-containing protein [Bacteroidota bacterium]
MKHFYLFFCACLFSTSLYGQWTPLNFSASLNFPHLEVMGDLVEHQGSLYASSASNTLLKSSDGGNTWAPCTTHSFWGTIDFLVATPNQLIAAARSLSSTGTLWTSSDGGNTWLLDTLGMPNHIFFADSKAFVHEIHYFDGHLVATFDNADAYFIKKLDDPAWQKNEYLAANDPEAYAVYQEQTLLVAGGFSFYYSNDQGSSWIEPANNGLPNWFVGQQLATNGEQIYIAGAVSPFGDQQLLVSNNMGEDWTSIDLSAILDSGQKIRQLDAFDQRLFVSLDNDLTNSSPELFYSDDQGESFVNHNGGLAVDEFGTDYIKKIIRYQNSLYALGNFRDIYRQDFTSSVSTLATSLPSLKVYPNPCRDLLFVEFTEVNPSSFQVFNQVGQSVGTHSKSPIDVSPLPAGRYYLRDTRGAVSQFVKH